MSKFDTFEIVAGSFPADVPDSDLQEVDDRLPITLTLHLRRKQPLLSREISASRRFLSHEELEHNHGANFSDVLLVFEFAHHFGLGIQHVHIPSRTIVVTGLAANIARAFRTKIIQCREDGKLFHAPEAPIHVPSELAPVIIGVIGLDNRPKAKPHFRMSLKRKPSLGLKPDAFDGNRLANVYNFPAGTGKAETIGILELGGGYEQSDLVQFFSDLNLPLPNVKSVAVAGGSNAPGIDSDADIEVALDIEVSAAVAPDANVVLYFAPNTDQGFLQAILACVHDTQNKCSTMSISWGAAEVSWNTMQMTIMDDAFQTAAALGISVFVAAGDDGCNDNVGDGKVHVDFPSSSPNVCSCGGSTLLLQNGERQETAWNDGDSSATGGGISNVFPRPNYQNNLVMPANLNGTFSGRGLPDLAANSDPETGYSVFVDGSYIVVGGTSAVAPLMAGYMARVNALSGQAHGLINPRLYAPGNTSAFNDITSGNNSCDGVTGYSAAVGWDAVSGFGSPNGIALQQLLLGSLQPPH
jgi:kumamolisin